VLRRPFPLYAWLLAPRGPFTRSDARRFAGHTAGKRVTVAVKSVLIVRAVVAVIIGGVVLAGGVAQEVGVALLVLGLIGTGLTIGGAAGVSASVDRARRAAA
jgi:hypothetical protein